jgi:hypothetical protein
VVYRITPLSKQHQQCGFCERKEHERTPIPTTSDLGQRRSEIKGNTIEFLNSNSSTNREANYVSLALFSQQNFELQQIENLH